jgi:hypothetical protein
MGRVSVCVCLWKERRERASGEIFAFFLVSVVEELFTVVLSLGNINSTLAL